MGVSPYYRGCDCNFWALYDNNPHLVGATIHICSDSKSYISQILITVYDVKKDLKFK